MINGYKKLAEKIHPNFIIVTGDYRHIKCKTDYSDAFKFLEEIVVLFDVKKEDIFLVPGNHDVENYEFRNESIQAIIKDIDVNPDAYITYMKKTQNLNMAFDKYNEFVKNFYGKSAADERILKPSSIMCLSWHGKMNILI